MDGVGSSNPEVDAPPNKRLRPTVLGAIVKHRD